MLLQTQPPVPSRSERPPRIAAPVLEAQVIAEPRAVRCAVRNLSLTGLYLEGLRAPVGRELELVLVLPDESDPLRVGGRVVRTEAGGAGLVFSRIGWDDLLAVSRFLAPRL